MPILCHPQRGPVTASQTPPSSLLILDLRQLLIHLLSHRVNIHLNSIIRGALAGLKVVRRSANLNVGVIIKIEVAHVVGILLGAFEISGVVAAAAAEDDSRPGTLVLVDVVEAEDGHGEDADDDAAQSNGEHAKALQQERVGRGLSAAKVCRNHDEENGEQAKNSEG